MSLIKNEVGNVYGRLTVLYRAEDKVYGGRKKTTWHCRCECGNECDVLAESLRQGLTKSCGCYNCECQKSKETKYRMHGMRETRLYSIWRGIKKRCLNERNDNYAEYGGRGITICDSWLDNFEDFATWALNNGYSNCLTIDRIDVNGDYCPENCRWVTQTQQQRNKRNNHLITYNNETHCLSEWCEITGNSKDYITYWEGKDNIKKALTPIS